MHSNASYLEVRYKLKLSEEGNNIGKEKEQKLI
jgi:hypothetical protein